MAHIYDTITHRCKAIRRIKPTQEQPDRSNSPYTWRENGDIQEILWDRRVDCIQELSVFFGTELCDKRFCGRIFTAMKVEDKRLLMRCLQFSEVLEFPSTKEFLASCASSTIDESQLAKLQDQNSGMINIADFSRLSVSIT